MNKRIDSKEKLSKTIEKSKFNAIKDLFVIIRRKIVSVFRPVILVKVFHQRM